MNTHVKISVGMVSGLAILTAFLPLVGFKKCPSGECAENWVCEVPCGPGTDNFYYKGDAVTTDLEALPEDIEAGNYRGVHCEMDQYYDSGCTQWTGKTDDVDGFACIY